MFFLNIFGKLAKYKIEFGENEDGVKMNYEKWKRSVVNWFQKIWSWLTPYLLKLKNKTKRSWRKYHISKLLIILVLSLSIISCLSLYVFAKRTDVENMRAALEQSTIIYDHNGKEAGKLYSQKGSFVSINNISPDIKQALISTEDQRFEKHKGFDLIGIARAAVGYVIHGGNIVGGGSTITQQLAKNAFLSLDQTLSRKLKELFLAIEIEKQYTKDEIIEMYLNQSYFGNGVWGVEDASQKYFGKSAARIDLAQAATLVGMLKAPTSYNPIDNPEKAITRRNIVLQLMVEEEAVSKEKASAAKTEKLVLIDRYQKESGYNYPYYFDSIIREATNKYGFSEENILNSGYKIYTSLDQTAQKKMMSVYENDYLFDDADDGMLVQSASVLLDSKTGGVMALIGGRGNHEFRGYNRATQARLQPGSTIKPLGVYTPALKKGYKADSLLKDEEGATFGEDNFHPTNWNHQYLGEVPLYEALANSLNVPAVWLLNEIGLKTSQKTLQDFGIPISEKDRNLASMALGGMSGGVSPLQMASAYTAFANGGVRSEGSFITKIVDPTGAVIVDQTQPKQNRVMTEKMAKDMTSLMMGVFSNGTGRKSKPDGYTIAGKTGSTQLNFKTNSGGTKDQWTIGYTPDIVLTSWMGFDVTTAENKHYLTSGTSTGIGPIFKQEMEKILPNTSLTAFETESAEKLIEENKSNDNWKETVKDTIDTFGKTFSNGAEKVKEKTTDLFNKWLETH